MMTLTELRDNGTLEYLYQKGIISYKLFCYLDYCQSYQSLILQGFNKESAVLEVSIKHNVSRATVYRAIKTVNMSQNTETT